MEIVKNPNIQDEDLDINMVTFTVSVVVTILITIFCFQTYFRQKKELLQNLEMDGARVETLCNDHIAQNYNLITLIVDYIRQNPDDSNYVSNLLNTLISNQQNNIFEWTEYTWFDRKMHGIAHNLDINHDIVLERSKMKDFAPQFMINYVSKSMELIYPVTNDNNEHLGTLVVKFAVHNIMDQLNIRINDPNVNIALIPQESDIVLPTYMSLDYIEIEDGKIKNINLLKDLEELSLAGRESHKLKLNILTGANYYVKKLNKLPFSVLVSIDDKELKETIFHSIYSKFMEIAIIALCFFVLIILIYRRETMLRRHAEHASQIAIDATNAKTDFLAFTAHEIRSPLGFIISGSEVMQKELFGPLGEKYKDYVNGISSNAKLVLDFITDILDESHILNGTFKIDLAQHDIVSIVNNSIKINQTKNEQKNIKVNLHNENGLPQLICDKNRFLQIMNNLISNAIKYSPENSAISIFIKIKEKKLVIEVCDEGIGMSQEDIEVAFKKYGRARQENLYFAESYGLGLPIVKMILDAHDAEIEVLSNEYVGTTFKVSFPEDKLVF